MCQSPETTVVQQLIPAAFKQPLDVRSDRTKAITEAIGIYISSAMCPYSVVEDPGFKYLLNVLEPRYTVPSRAHIRQSVVPSLYTRTRALIEHDLSTAPAVALTTDGWTSRATESYLTVTAHFINSEWEMKSPVLQTRPVYEQHTSTHLAEKLQEAVAERKLKPVAVTTDNARNIVNAVSDAGLGPHIGCFAHTLNLASQKGMAVSQVSRLLGKIRKTVGFFHRSSVAAHILETKQKMLNLPKHCLIHDVPTRWNSSYEMVERYLEQISAVYSALTERAHKNKDIANLTDHELSIAESVIEIMKPLKMVTTILSTETTPSVSMILPLKKMILESMKQNDGDTPTAREIKQAISENLQTRYSSCPGLEDFLHKCTALDPRFKTLPHLEPAYQQRIYEDILITEVLSRAQQGETRETTEPSPSAVTADSEVAPSPPPKRSAMAEFFAHSSKLLKSTSLICSSS